MMSVVRKMLFVVVTLVLASLANAAEVSPQLGGGSGDVAVNMKHVGIGYSPGGDLQFGTADDVMHIDVDEVVAPGYPMLRPLNEGDTFTAGNWQTALDGKAYNHQYGWLAGTGLVDLFAHFGSSGDIWIQRLDSTPGLETFETMMMPGSGSYAPILGTEGSSNRWDWGHNMTHLAYAVEDPALDMYSATYLVYVADTSGEMLPGYASAEVTLHFTADPVPEPAALIGLLFGVVGLRRRR